MTINILPKGKALAVKFDEKDRSKFTTDGLLNDEALGLRDKMRNIPGVFEVPEKMTQGYWVLRVISEKADAVKGEIKKLGLVIGEEKDFDYTKDSAE